MKKPVQEQQENSPVVGGSVNAYETTASFTATGMTIHLYHCNLTVHTNHVLPRGHYKNHAYFKFKKGRGL